MSEKLKPEEIENLSEQILTVLEFKPSVVEKFEASTSDISRDETVSTHFEQKLEKRLEEISQLLKGAENGGEIASVTQNSVNLNSSVNEKMRTDFSETELSNFGISKDISLSLSDTYESDMSKFDGFDISGDMAHNSVQNMSDYLQKDSRRYDSELKKF